MQFRTGTQTAEFACYEAELDGIRPSTGDSSKKKSTTRLAQQIGVCVCVTKCTKTVARAAEEHSCGSQTLRTTEIVQLTSFL